MKSHFVYTILCIAICLQSCAQNTPKETSLNDKSPVQLSDKEWREKLTPDQYYVLREKGTERAFSGEFVFTKDAGTYKCDALFVVCSFGSNVSESEFTQ